MNSFVTCMKKYFEFGGRASRTEFWVFQLVILVISYVAGVCLGLLFSGTGVSYHGGYGVDRGADLAFSILQLLVIIFLLIPRLSVGVRRLHDADISGWWILIGLVPILGWLLIFFLFLKPGTEGENRYGFRDD